MAKITVTLTLFEFPTLYGASMEGRFLKTKEFGVNYVEGTRSELKKDLGTFKKLLKKYDLGVDVVYAGAVLNRPNTVDEVKKQYENVVEAISLARKVDSSIVVTYWGGNKSRDDEISLRLLRENIGPCIKAAEDNDVRIVIENEFTFGSVAGQTEGLDITGTAKGALMLLGAVDSEYFKLNFDTANFYVAGEEPFPYAYELIKGRFGYMHAKDAAKYDPRIHGEDRRSVKGACGVLTHLDREYVFMSIGEGAINWDGLMKKLTEDGYDGFMAVETEVPESQMSYAYWKGIKYLTERGASL